MLHGARICTQAQGASSFHHGPRRHDFLKQLLQVGSTKDGDRSKARGLDDGYLDDLLSQRWPQEPSQAALAEVSNTIAIRQQAAQAQHSISDFGRGSDLKSAAEENTASGSAAAMRAGPRLLALEPLKQKKCTLASALEVEQLVGAIHEAALSKVAPATELGRGKRQRVSVCYKD